MALVLLPMVEAQALSMVTQQAVLVAVTLPVVTMSRAIHTRQQADTNTAVKKKVESLVANRAQAKVKLAHRAAKKPAKEALKAKKKKVKAPKQRLSLTLQLRD